MFVTELPPEALFKALPTLTNHRAPHKPFLLLFALDLIAQNEITSTPIEPSFDPNYPFRVKREV